MIRQPKMREQKVLEDGKTGMIFYGSRYIHQHHVEQSAYRSYGLWMSHKLLNISRGLDGWTVRIVRQGQQHSKYFRFSDGGVRASLARAQRWRDKKLKELGQRQWKKGPRRRPSNNSSGITGVSKNFYGRWLATWQQDGVQRFKTFKTKKEAIAHRKAKIADSNAD